MKIWVIGANGLLGSAMKGHASLATGKEVDISNFSALKVALRPEITHIVNCAAFSLVDLAEVQREEAFRTNVLGPENLSKLGPKLIHISTDYVFEGYEKKPLKEEDPTNPISYYGYTKLEGEKRLSQNCCIIRTSWIFGSGGKNFVGKLFNMLQTEEEIWLTNDHWGRPTYVLDLCKAALHLMDYFGVYHFANVGATNKYEFGMTMLHLAKELGIKTKTKKIHSVSGSTFPSFAKRPPYSVFDTSKIEKFIPVRSWQDALREFLCTYL